LVPLPNILFAVMPKCGSLVGQTDFEQKSSADEREAYIGTLSEETTICKQNFIKTEKTVGFQPWYLKKIDIRKGRGTGLVPLPNILFAVMPKCGSPYFLFEIFCLYFIGI